MKVLSSKKPCRRVKIALEKKFIWYVFWLGIQEFFWERFWFLNNFLRNSVIVKVIEYNPARIVGHFCLSTFSHFIILTWKILTFLTFCNLVRPYFLHLWHSILLCICWTKLSARSSISEEIKYFWEFYASNSRTFR